MANPVLPGDMVVPLSQIVDLLKSKLSQSEIDALLNSLFSGVPKQVRPGDLIPAELMNQIFAELANLETRVAKLEVTTPVTGTGMGVFILEPNTNTVLRIGDSLTIKGINLLKDSIVKIDETTMIGLEGSLDNMTLVLKSIPPIDNIVGEGRTVTLLVSNSAGSNTAQFTLKPRELTVPIGTVLVAQTGGPIPAPLNNTYKANTRYTFIFTITSDTRPDETFSLNPSMDNAWAAEVIDPLTDKAITPSEILIEAAKNATTPTVKKVYVAVTIPGTAQSGDTGNLTLLVQSKRNQTIQKTTAPPIAITVEGAVQVPKNMSISLLNTAGDAGMRDNGDGTKTALIVVDSSTGGELEFEVNVPTTGQYKIDTAKLSTFLDDQAPAKWSASVPGALNGVVTLNSPKGSFKILVKATTGAKAAQMILDLSSTAPNSQDAGYLALKVEPLTLP